MDTIEPEHLAYEDVIIDEKYSRGQGYVISSGNLSGRLNFSFTSESDTTFVQFKDLFGRKTLFLILSGEKIEAWDILNKQRYDNTSILLTLPFLEMTTSSDLRKIFWGLIPPAFSTEAFNDSAVFNGRIQFNSTRTKIGPLVSKVIFNMDDMSKMELIITEREFGSQYPHLIKSIPESIPAIKLDTL